MKAPFGTFKGRTCNGSFELGNACGQCERCDWEDTQHTSPAVEWGTGVAMRAFAQRMLTERNEARDDAAKAWDERNKAYSLLERVRVLITPVQR